MRLLVPLAFFYLVITAEAQQLRLDIVDNNALAAFQIDDDIIPLPTKLPVLSYEADKTLFTTIAPSPRISAAIQQDKDFRSGVKYIVTFANTSKDTLRLSNVVPFGISDQRVYLTGKGEHPLSRANLFIPGKVPVNVILPDNAWEAGYSSVGLSYGVSIAALARRDPSTLKKGARRRFETILYPGGSISYNFFAETYNGRWQNGLKKIFQDRYLYDLQQFDSSLYQRSDLRWVRHSYVMHLLMAWDKEYYDQGVVKLPDFVKRGKVLYGGDDVVGLWPTWPTLGLDQRNQFDLFRDLPGGLPALRALSDTLRNIGTRFFVCYNPWDESTRNEGHLAGLGQLIRETSADGAVLDTRGESSKELQAAADQVRQGVVMYSEGMAVPRNMPGIVSGRVHNALYYPPMLNLNKLIKPDFAIFRVVEVFKEPIRREFAIAFFNGYGTEINQFAAGHPYWEEEQYRFLGRTSRILRENTFNFVSKMFTPLIPTVRDSIWVNQWEHGDKIVYTVYSDIPGGFSGPLFEVIPSGNFHYVDIWNHEEIEPALSGGRWMIATQTEAFHQKYLGTNNAGSVSCVVRFPKLLGVALHGDVLKITTKNSSEVRIWTGIPSYDKKPVALKASEGKTIEVSLSDLFRRFEGKFVIQMMHNGILQDEKVVLIEPGTPRLISARERTSESPKAVKGMIRIPAGKFTFRTSHGDEFIRYPDFNEGVAFEMSPFLIDKFPVTNADFKKFLDASGYIPGDSSNFLKHWNKGNIPAGMERYPVVFISWEDAKAYAVWAGKRLPTEVEWQYAAQTSALNEWPWKQQKPVERKEEIITETLTVSSLHGIDPDHANLGDGKLYPVGKYPKGVNPFGISDLVGSVWQLTADLYQSGSYRYVIMKGGSYFKPSSSWWYVQGGPRELHYRQFLLRVSERFERNGTVGFRCVKDLR